ncbi:cytochrome-c peroxidase [Helicobacter pylori]|uniref:cytochrome-c peroxidase n=1 Tax=Helicobacter pylori TaxID=210 RepID=UPI001FD6B7AC|nr:cytochrome-c peroxidase [Helicobacter pylori]UOR43598.1 cytochrome-c peroxidase [Helicobacter pylori]
MKKFVLLGVCLAFSCAHALSDMDLIKKARESQLEPMPMGKALKEYQIKKTKDVGIGTKNSEIMTPAQVELGKMLYFDPRISTSYLVSCNTCHNLGLGGVDLVPSAVGSQWKKNPHLLSSPTVYNSVFNDVQFWDGRVTHLNEQAQGPIQSSFEMGADPKVVVEKINSMPGYVKLFRKAYGTKVKIDFKLIADSIAMFEATLITPSRYDDFLRGNPKALSKAEKEGLDLFISKGCVACHNGINLGGTMQPFGVVKPYKFANVGDFKGDKNGLVKVPTLRNITETMPYFHNGQFWDVKDAIKEMGSIQLGIEISDEEAKKIETFFEALKGKKPKILYPELPIITDKTPKPSF